MRSILSYFRSSTTAVETSNKVDSVSNSTAKRKNDEVSTKLAKRRIDDVPTENLFCPICLKEAAQSKIVFEAHVERCLNQSMKPFVSTAIAIKPIERREEIPIKPSHPVDYLMQFIIKDPKVTVGKTTSPTEYPKKKVVDKLVVESKVVKKKRECPWYKLLTDTPFSVDAFSFGAIPGCSAYFLTHFHSDHYGGLSSLFTGSIYCSQITANLIIQELRVNRDLVHVLPLGESIVQGVKVTCLDANHCPGAVIILFELPASSKHQTPRRYLHCGDFRACDLHWNNPLLRVRLDRIYLDTTYCKIQHSFPSQITVLNLIESLVLKVSAGESVQTIISGNPLKHFFAAPKKSRRTLFVVGSYLIGKEKVFMTIARAIKAKIYTIPRKMKVYKAVEDAEMNTFLTTDPREAKVHVVPMNAINSEALEKLLTQYDCFDRVIAFRPTGWTFSSKTVKDEFKMSSLKPSYLSDEILVIPVPYSEHSSYAELKEFIQTLNVVKIIPTVNLGQIKEMNLTFGEWKRS